MMETNCGCRSTRCVTTSVGDPDRTSPVLVTANYKTTFDLVRRMREELPCRGDLCAERRGLRRIDHPRRDARHGHPEPEERMNTREEALLRTALIAGAITDTTALLPMLFPSLADFFWGFRDVSASYRFAMGYGASLMLGWTVLLLWAYRRPIERRFVAAPTVLVTGGLIRTEMVAVHSGAMEAWRMVPTWCLQALLLVLFARAYHYSALRR